MKNIVDITNERFDLMQLEEHIRKNVSFIGGDFESFYYDNLSPSSVTDIVKFLCSLYKKSDNSPIYGDMTILVEGSHYKVSIDTNKGEAFEFEGDTGYTDDDFFVPLHEVRGMLKTNIMVFQNLLTCEIMVRIYTDADEEEIGELDW